MGIYNPDGRVFGGQVRKRLDQYDMLEHVGMVTGMEAVSVAEQRKNYCWRLSSGPEIVLATPLIAEPATLTPVSTTVPTTLAVVDTTVPAIERTAHPEQARSSKNAAAVFIIEMPRLDIVRIL